MAITAVANLSYDQTAWDQLAHYALRPELYFDRFADVKATRQSMEGAAVSFVLQADMAANTTALTEATSATPTTLSDSTVTLTLVEYGDLAQTTAKLRGTSFVPVDPIVANVVGYAAGISLDTLARDKIVAGTNVFYGGTATSRVTVAATHTMDADDVRKAVAQLKGANVPTWDGSYVGIIHPDVEYDFQGETGTKSWREPHVYSEPGAVYTGEIGKFQGVRFISASRAPFVADGGVGGTVDVYQNLFFGRQAMAKAHSKSDGNGPLPRVRPAPVTYPHWRFTGVGWYWLGVYGIFREACIRRVETASSLGAN